ncbi:hypothetical protein A3Q56_08493, partial [Intoshia linei]
NFFRMNTTKASMFLEGWLTTVNKKKKNNTSFSLNKLNSLIEILKTATIQTTTKSTEEYFAIKTYDIVNINDIAKLIKKYNSESDPILYYVANEELFYRIHDVHMQQVHGGINKMMVHLKKRVEKANDEIHKQLVFLMRDNNTQHWSVGLKFVQFQKNSSYHSRMRTSPCEAFFGTPATLGLTKEKIYKNQEIQSIKMIEKGNKIFGPLKEGDCVRIPIPHVDRGRLDPGNLIDVVTGVDHGQYTIGTCTGKIENNFTRNQILSLRSTVREKSIGWGQGFFKCNCKGGCSVAAITACLVPINK